MMDSLEHYFYVLIQCVCAVYLAMGVVLSFWKVPTTAEYVPYRNAKRSLTTTFFIMALNLLAWLNVSSANDWTMLNPLVKCIDFMFFYLEAVFFCYTFYYLVNEKCMTWRKVLKDWAIFLVSSALMVLSVLRVFGKASSWIGVLPFLAFFVQVVIFLHRFYYLYNEKRKKLDDYFAEDMQLYMFWTKKSLFFIILTGILSFASLLFGIIYNYLFQIYVVSANLYIAISFMHYAQLYGKLNLAEVKEKDRIETQEEEQKTCSIDNYEQLFGEHVLRWLDDKKYLASQLTIDDMAAAMGTNKLYMSRYINRKYGVNFSAWITQLRLEEAKSYMKANPNVKQEEVAFHSGFSSSSYFSKVFSRIEGMTPAAWRKEITQRLTP